MKKKALAPLILAMTTLMSLSSSIALGQVERLVVRVDGMA